MATGSRDSVTQRDVTPRPRDQSEVAVLWTASEVRCVLARYDETRYQLRLLRGLGTIKTELFADCAKAIVASHDWRHASSRHRTAGRRRLAILRFLGRTANVGCRSKYRQFPSASLARDGTRRRRVWVSSHRAASSASERLFSDNPSPTLSANDHLAARLTHRLPIRATCCRRPRTALAANGCDCSHGRFMRVSVVSER